jgi:hypothetical protein
MTDYNNTNDVLTNEALPKATLPQGLNVLTILTFIGCAFYALATLATPWLMNFSLKMMDKAASGSADLSQAKVAELEQSRALIELTKANMIPLLAIGLIGIGLCFAGALMMRKYKKDGFWIYVAGQIIPLVGSFALLGTKQFTGVTSYIGLIFPIVFIVLYSLQRKHLTK